MTDIKQDAQFTEIAREFRHPHNGAANRKGSIHDDATASKLGFKGGTVAGSVHMDQFAPLMLELYGDDWLGRGDLSLYFQQATVDKEAVRCFAQRLPGAGNARVRMENQAGELIIEGTASCGETREESELTRRVAAQAPAAPGALRILAGCKVGDVVADVPLRIASEALDKRLETITERIEAYDASQDTPAALPPSLSVHLYRPVQEALLKLASRPVGLFGAIELRAVAGPLRVETDYVGRGRILALSESPRTENIWYQAWASDPVTGEDIAWMIMYLRFLKASSPLYG